MKTKDYILLSVVPFFSFCSKNKPASGGPKPPAVTSLLQISGHSIIDSSGKTFLLKGVVFGNEVWSDKEVPDTHHGEIDFGRVQAMGMNAIRFNMNYKTFENDAAPYQYKQAGWDWLDKNIAWAKKYGIYLVLNMHVPQGGFQSQGTGDELWTNTEKQNRLAGLWKAIADHCKNEPAIAGYGIVNEPVPTTSLTQWLQLSQRLTTAIRSVDQQHLIFAEKPIYVKGASTENADLNFPLSTDKKTVYEFHFYDPFQFTHQLFEWAKQGDGGKYPDEKIISFTNINWYTATSNNPSPAAGNSGWTAFEGELFKVNDTKQKIAIPALVASGVGGRVYFDNIVIKEFNATGQFTRELLNRNLNNLDGWSYWSSNNTGSFGLSTATGAGDNASIYIENATNDCNLSNFVSAFEPVQGYSYRVSGSMKGENIAAGAGCKFRIDFYDTDKPVYKRNKQYLTAALNDVINWSKQKNLPVFLGEFGAGSHCFEQDKGGLLWVTDMLDICKENNLSFIYHSYHEDSFGLYYGYGNLPDPTKRNQPLIDLFTSKLK
jgi:endoglucanase